MANLHELPLTTSKIDAKNTTGKNTFQYLQQHQQKQYFLLCVRSGWSQLRAEKTKQNNRSNNGRKV